MAMRPQEGGSRPVAPQCRRPAVPEARAPRPRRPGLRAAAVLGLLGLCGLAGCTREISLGPGDGLYRRPGLEGIAASFLAPGSGISGGSAPASAPAPAPSGAASGAGFWSGVRIDRDMLKPGSDTPYRESGDLQLGLRFAAREPLGPGRDLVAALRLEAGRHEYVLPAGLGPLGDPIEIGFRRLAVIPEIGLSRRWPVALPPGGEIELSALLGHEISHLDSHLTSALLDVRSRQTLHQSYLSLGAGLRLGREGQGGTLQGRVTLAEGGQWGWRSELRLPLAR